VFPAGESPPESAQFTAEERALGDDGRMERYFAVSDRIDLAHAAGSRPSRPSTGSRQPSG
jgi:hypothetical protein